MGRGIKPQERKRGGGKWGEAPDQVYKRKNETEDNEGEKEKTADTEAKPERPKKEEEEKQPNDEKKEAEEEEIIGVSLDDFMKNRQGGGGKK